MKKVEPRVEEYKETGEIVGSPSKGKEPKKYYPHIRLEHEFFPETKKQEVGKEYEIKLKVKMTGLSISKFDNTSEYDVVGYECEPEDMEDD